MAYPPTYPLLAASGLHRRHTTFGALFLRRPAWLIRPYTALVLQIYNGHGVNAWTLWHRDARIEWVSVLTVIAATLGLVVVIVDRVNRERARTPPDPV